MSSIVSTPQVHAFHHASDIPEEVWSALLQNEAAANVVLPFAKKALHFPRGGDNDQLWIAVYDDDTKSVEFVLSCVKGSLGNYPIFIVSCKSSAELVEEEQCGKRVADSLLPLVLRLLEEVPPQRVFSVFSIAKVTKTFAEIFQEHVPQQHGIQAFEDAYYDATFTFCTSETLKKEAPAAMSYPGSEDIVIALRRADMSDLEGTKILCREFSKTSPPFVLDDAGAELEAKLLITNQQVWLHMIQTGDQAPEIACLVATSRESDKVTAVTKVMTSSQWRGHGCAERLLHRVCQETLQKKTRVVLYVGNSDGLAPARNLYHKIGFQGLQGQQVEGVEQWVEIGFKGTTLGYW